MRDNTLATHEARLHAAINGVFRLVAHRKTEI